MEGGSRRSSCIRGLTVCWLLDLPSSDVAKEQNASAWKPFEGIDEDEAMVVAVEVDVGP